MRRVEGWLDPFSARFILSLARVQDALDEQGGVGEIGVHHGKLFILLALCLRADEGAFAIDVFGRQDLNVDHSGRGDRDVFLRNLRRWAPDARVEVLEISSLRVRPEMIAERCGSIRLASIDGGHTEECVLNDLALCEAVLSRRGVVILDDCFNQFWPSVASGMARYMLGRQRRLRVFAITPNKTYLAATEAVPAYQAWLRQANGFHFEKSTDFYGDNVDIYGTQPYTYSLEHRLIEWVKATPLAPAARALRRRALPRPPLARQQEHDQQHHQDPGEPVG